MWLNSTCLGSLGAVCCGNDESCVSSATSFIAGRWDVALVDASRAGNLALLCSIVAAAVARSKGMDGVSNEATDFGDKTGGEGDETGVTICINGVSGDRIGVSVNGCIGCVVCCGCSG